MTTLFIPGVGKFTKKSPKRPTKLRQVIKFIRAKKKHFRWKEFNTRFGGSQTCLTYLCYLKNAGYVALIGHGLYTTLRKPSMDLQHDDLYFQAYGKKLGERTTYEDAGGGIKREFAAHFEGGSND